MNIINHLISYIIAFLLVTASIYIFDLPTFITGNVDLVKEYYHTNFVKSFFFDLFLIAIYILVAELIIYYVFHINNEDHILEMGVMILVTICISGFFLLLFKYVIKGHSFFDRWFRAVGYKAIVYDVCLCLTAYVLYRCILKKYFLL